ncbi:hypothetical protein BBJ28_00003989 [Nothophytophthora sp. Chile5]|nr:hypothetical protein BBJ28_00003989 [Nothophytophthora sp. Chile5]
MEESRQNGGLVDADADVPAPLQPPQQDGEADVDDQLTDSGRNWSPDVLLELVKIWRRVYLAHPGMSRVLRMQQVYDAFRQTVDCSHRSRKAVDDKLYSMKQMYQFISKMNGNFKQGGARKTLPSWFELTKEERRAVRSLHRVRIPNISLDVFNVFDSILNPNPLASRYNDENSGALTGTALSSITPLGEGSNGNRTQTATMMPSAPASSEDPPEIVDIKRNWSYDVTLQLARVWNSVHKENPVLRGATLSQSVYNAFMAAVGGSNRSRKAVDDKMHSMKEMYRFMKAYEMARLGGDGKIAWFDLTKPQRREIRAQNKIRVPNLAPDVYNEIDMLMARMSQVSPAESVIESPSAAVPSADLESGQVNPFVAAVAPNGGSILVSSVGASLEVMAAPLTVQSNPSNGQNGQVIRDGGVTQTNASSPEKQQSNGSHQETQEFNGVDASASMQTSQLPAPSSAVYYPSRQGLEPGTPKRRRIGQEQQETPGYAGATAMPAPTLIDAHAAREFMEQMRLVLGQDREERRQQHAEQMSALREIAELLKRRG